ncbi:MAG: FtsW/RodA/SpoVE family cell cycle protein [Clostridia bacterium]|nr:FtsW/RodA/SpoVE family cell cycle protein [Clostridia bacterium]
MVKYILSYITDYCKRTDKIFWLLTMVASFYGFCLIASQQRADDVNFLRTQIFAVCIGYIAAVVISVMDYNFIAKLWWIWAGISLMLTIAVFFIGIQVGGTDDVGWIKLPGGMTFQPSELTKICFILTFSKHLSYLTEKNKLYSFIGVATLVLHAAVPIGLIHLQGDDGAALVFALMFIVMTFAAGVQLRYFIILFVIVLCAVPLLWSKVLNEDQKNRLMVLFNPDDTAFQTYGWQQYQGKVSIASGGLFGKGLFNGPRVARQVVPYQENDFIFTVAGEELGFIGCMAILLLFAFLLIKLLISSAKACNPLGKNICMGFFALVGIQVIINLGMVLGILPVVGITLPFFSSGGSSVACLYLGVGLVQSVHMHPTDPDDKPVRIERNQTIRGSVFTQ